jgi:Tfp pilus assembly protein PilF
MACAKLLLISLLSLWLVACAGGGTKNEQADVNTLQPRHEYVDVDADVQLDFNSAVSLLKQKQYPQAEAVLKSVVEREQRLPAPYINLAMAQLALDETDAAEQNLIKALKLDINHPVANNELGLLYRKTGKFKAARTAYENAISEHPDYLPARRNLGVLCDLYMHDYQCALDQFEVLLAHDPDNKNMEIWVADVKRRLGK